jgi:hypothetical protein
VSDPRLDAAKDLYYIELLRQMGRNVLAKMAADLAQMQKLKEKFAALFVDNNSTA